jgi:LemA protein
MREGAMTVLFVVLGVVVFAAIVAISLYNGLISKKNLAQEGWSGIDVQLKRRADLIPNLVDTVKGYAAHESAIFEKVADTRAQTFKATNPEDRAKAEGLLSGALTGLFAVAENYPDLKASQNFQELQKSLADVEEQIQMARRYYNGAARNLNIAVQSFPGNLVANQFHIGIMPYFELGNSADKAVPQASF